MGESDPAHGRIVVGVDGSPGSHDALQWGAGYAEMTGKPVLLVMAWHFPVMYGTVPVPGVDFETEAGRVLEDTAKAARAEFPEVQFETRLVAGRPSDVLAGASDGEDLLVVGSRGHGAFTGMLVGSVNCVSISRFPLRQAAAGKLTQM